MGRCLKVSHLSVGMVLHLIILYVDRSHRTSRLETNVLKSQRQSYVMRWLMTG